MITTKAIGCEVLHDEWMAVNKRRMETCFLEQGLHRYPEKLHQQLQAAIDQTDQCDAILLLYGLCSNALLGIKAGQRRLIVPLVEDCIGLFLGSCAAYLEQFRREPATYYFTKGWVVSRKDPYQEYLASCEKWGKTEADWIAREMMKNYRRVAYIDTKCYDATDYHKYAADFASFFRLRLERLTGTVGYLQDLHAGTWERCLTVAPGEEICEEKFREAMKLSI